MGYRHREIERDREIEREGVSQNDTKKMKKQCRERETKKNYVIVNRET